jgi:hypothetical protein
MRCIYCRKSTTENSGKAHVFPEALAQNRLTLPRGVICDHCNNYIGIRLDQNLVRYPLMAFAIQFLGTSGKRGKPRCELGRIPRAAGIGDFTLTLSLKEPEPLVTPEGKRRFRAHVLGDPEFDFLRFRRTLHSMALAVVAYTEGADRALEIRCDPVRTYIRQPRPQNLAWPYAQLEPRSDTIPRDLCAGRAGGSASEIIVMQLFQALYAVDLINSESLEYWAHENGFVYVPADQSTPPPVTLEFGEK